MTSIEGEGPTPKKKRDTSRFEEERAARQAVKSTTEKIGVWQAEIARLRGQVRHGLTAEARHAMTLVAKSLEIEVANAAAVLRRETPDALKSHSRFVDTQRALASIEAGIKSLAGGLEP